MSAAGAGEFDLIRRYFAPAQGDSSVVLGIGDDCALLQPEADSLLAVSVDTLVEGVHFLPDLAPQHVASRALGAAVSDLAAMGATPAWYTLALSLPQADEVWVAAFAAALHGCANRFGIRLIGGDTTRGRLTVTVQVHGFVPRGDALMRKGAAPGDLICVTGTLGDSRAGLETLLKAEPESAVNACLRTRFYAPEPRLTCGVALRGVASACIDISDGLLADLGHILSASGCGADLDSRALPLSPALLAYAGPDTARAWALRGGEDFELCFTLPASRREHLATLPTPVAVIGQITANGGIRIDGTPVTGTAGYDHFAGDCDE